MDLRYLLLPLLSVSSALLLQTPTAFVPDGVPVTRSESHKIFHQASGLCVLRKSLTEPLKLGPCTESDAWNYTPQKFLTIKGTYFCLQATGAATPARLAINCTPDDSQWNTLVSSSDGSGHNNNNNEKTHLATKMADGTTVCLDVNSDDHHTVISNPCLSFGEEGDSQWFKIVAAQPRAGSAIIA